MTTPHTASTTDAKKRLAENTADPLDNWEYTLTGRALRQMKAEAWDEAIEAVAWCLDNGESSTAAALAYVHKNNRHRATSDVTP